MKLAEALLRRKELEGKVKMLSVLKADQLFVQQVVRKNVTDSVDDITIKWPKLTASQVMAEFNFHSSQLRILDAAIQQANWTTELPVLSTDVMGDFPQPPKEEVKA